MDIVNEANKIVCREDKFEGKCKYAVIQIKDKWCDSVADFHMEHDKEDINAMLKVDSELEGYYLMVAYPNSKVLRDFICQEEVDDCLEDMRKEEPKKNHEEDIALMCCIGWRIDEFRNNDYSAEWLEE